MRSQKDLDDDFKRTMDVYLRLGAHERRGFTVEEYVEKSRALWDMCPTSEEFPLKLIVDQSVGYTNLAATAAIAYDDTEVRNYVDVPGHDADWYCFNSGLFRDDGSSVGVDMRTKPLDADPPEASAQRVILCLVDVLGFELRLKQDGLEQLLRTYRELLEKAVFVDEMRCTALHRRADGVACAAMFTLPVRYAHFSDTLLLWLPLAQPFVSPFLARCTDLVCEAVTLGIPVRGAVTIGQAVMHRPTATYLGRPIVEAARLEAAQEWLGIALGPSTLWPPFLHEIDPRLVLPLVPPHKPGTDARLSSYCLDWPRRWREKRTEPLTDALRRMNTLEKYRRYYSNAESFAEVSVANQGWYSSAAGVGAWESAGEFIVPFSNAMTVFDDSGQVIVRHLEAPAV